VITKFGVESERLELRCLDVCQVGKAYLGWVNDPMVTRFLEVRHNPPLQVESLRDYVSSVNKSENSILFGIFLKGGRGHVGNIKIGPIDWMSRRAEIGILIGETDLWGMGIAREAIDLLAGFASNQLELGAITAGFYESHVRSMSAFRKAGFHFETEVASRPQVGSTTGEAIYVFTRNFGHSHVSGR